jgi:hypothetical protein
MSTVDAYPWAGPIGQMTRDEYDCEGGCGRQWWGQPDWWLTVERTGTPITVITGAACRDCHDAAEPSSA